MAVVEQKKKESAKFTDVYRIDYLLSKDGRASLSTCTHIELKISRVVKQWSKKDLEAKERYSKELEIMKKFRGNPGIIQLCDAFDEEDTYSIVMQRGLSDVLVDMTNVNDGYDPYPEPVVVHIMRQVMTAVQSLHAASYVHRDLKPENAIIVGWKHPAGSMFSLPDVVLIDFEFCLPIGTKPSFGGGTLGYLAPELAGGVHPCSAAGDVWAMGVMMYAMLTTFALVDTDGTRGEILLRLNAFKKEPRMVITWAQYRRRVSGNMQALVQSMLELDPAKRITVSDALARLKLCAQ